MNIFIIIKDMKQPESIKIKTKKKKRKDSWCIGFIWRPI